MSVNVFIVGTEPFFNHFSNSKLQDIRDYCRDVWSTHIEDNDGNYTANIQYYSDYNVTVPESAMCNSCTTRERVNDADDWLHENWVSYSYTDVICVMDWNAIESDDRWGVAQEKAGTSRNKCTMVDLEETEGADGPWKYEKSEGVAMHELIHMFIDSGGWEHYPSVGSYGYASLMYDVGRLDYYCEKYDDPIYVDKKMGACARDDAREFIDNYL